MAKSIVLGDEYDRGLKKRLIEELKSLGATPLTSDWTVVGSQELDTMTVILDGITLTFENETYIGLTVSGPDKAVDAIAARLGKS